MNEENNWYLVMLVSMGMALVSLAISITSALAADVLLLLDSMMTVDAALPSLSSRSAATAATSASASASTSMGRVAARSRDTSSCFSTLLATTSKT